MLYLNNKYIGNVVENLVIVFNHTQVVGMHHCYQYNYHVHLNRNFNKINKILSDFFGVLSTNSWLREAIIVKIQSKERVFFTANSLAMLKNVLTIKSFETIIKNHLKNVEVWCITRQSKFSQNKFWNTKKKYFFR